MNICKPGRALSEYQENWLFFSSIAISVVSFYLLLFLSRRMESVDLIVRDKKWSRLKQDKKWSRLKQHWPYTTTSAILLRGSTHDIECIPRHCLKGETKEHGSKRKCIVVQFYR